MKKSFVSVALSLLAATPAMAASIGTVTSHSGADGDIAAAPIGNGSYTAVSTNNGVTGAGQIAGVLGTNGSEFTTDLFSAKAGDALDFYFNYITSDGKQYTDYAFAQLVDVNNANVAYLFTARTTPDGNTSPGFGLPANAATLSPTSSAIQLGTVFSDLGSDSGYCFGAGCGHTGWINSKYTIAADGTYAIRFGVTNVNDRVVESALAFSGITVAGVPVPLPGVPEPSTWALMIVGFGAIGGVMRKRSQGFAHA